MIPDEIGLDEAYAVATPDDNRRLYAAWAATYEDGFVASEAYVYHRQVAEIFCAAAPADGAVLDAGCGTGLVGVELRRLGVSVIDGIDISPEMLAKALEKAGPAGPVYRRLIEADLTEPLALADDAYAGVVSAGTFTHGHVGPDALDELLRVAQPGARMVVGINAVHFEVLGFRSKIDDCRDAGLLEAYELIQVPIYAGKPGDDLDHEARVAVLTVG